MSSDLERDIQVTREHLGEAVDALAAKLDVNTRAREKVAGTDKRVVGAVGAALVGALVGAGVLWWNRRD